MHPFKIHTASNIIMCGNKLGKRFTNPQIYTPYLYTSLRRVSLDANWWLHKDLFKLFVSLYVQSSLVYTSKGHS